MPEVVDNYAYSLARINWDLFGTLTFTKSVPPTKRAFGMAWAHFYQAAKLVNRPYGQLLIALRPELGEMFGRFHFHYLLGGTLASNVITLAHTLEYKWAGFSGLGALSKIRAYDRTKAGVEYVTKCLSSGTLGANEYELRKFNLSDSVTLSRSVFRVIESAERIGMAHAACARKIMAGAEPVAS